ncbi:MAG: DNA-processing protein DprA [Duodenibacillus sp.]
MTKMRQTQGQLDRLRLMMAADGVGVAHLRALIQAYADVPSILSAGRRSVERIIGRDASLRLFSDDLEEHFRNALEWLQATPNADVVTWLDDDYPVELVRAGQAPAVLWLRGRRDLLKAPGLWITGSEHADTTGLKDAEDFAAAVAARGWNVVSTLATPLEHGAALGAAASNKLIVLQSTGPDRLWPVAYRKVFMTAACNGLIISSNVPGTGFSDERLRKTRQLAASLARRVLVVQSEAHSPALEAVRTAAELGRDVAAIPGSIHAPLYKGCLQLIKSGALLAETVDDVLA